MERGTRSAGASGVVVTNRNSSGCLIVRKKGDRLGGGYGSSSSSRKQYESKVRKRPSVAKSDSESSDELLMPPVRRLGSETIRVCNGLTAFEQGTGEGSESGRKRDGTERIRHYEDSVFDNNDLEQRETKRNKLDVFDFDEYDDVQMTRMRKSDDDNGISLGARRFVEPMHDASSGIKRECETGSGRHIVYSRKNSYYDRASSLYVEDNANQSRFNANRPDAQLPLSLLKNKFKSDESIRVQGKNGVLKVMVNNKKAGPSEHYGHRKPMESKQSLRTEATAKKNTMVHPSPYSKPKLVQKPGSVVRQEKKRIASKKSFSMKNNKGRAWDSEDSGSLSDQELATTKTRKSLKKVGSEDEQTPLREKLPTTIMKEGKVKRGSGTEKQKLREKIREMLLSAGWTIDYRPRRNRDYLDAVYINPGGTAYWSIIKAYDALQKQLNDGDNEAKPMVNGSSFAHISDEVLSQLTRKTRKKMEQELKKKKIDGSESESDSEKKPNRKRSASDKHDMNSTDSDSDEEKLSSFIRQGSKSMKNKISENVVASASFKSQKSTHRMHDETDNSLSECDPHLSHGRKSRKHGRCTLLVRSSSKGLNSESGGFVPYTGKRTVLSWLIDSRTVALSQKVQYRRRKRVVLEGWIANDGIHCGCCSKILTVSKFEIHAGSKLRQPFQNIYLDSGVSLLQCQIDAWNRQENSEKISYHSVDIDGDDPNDDTCGICGDGGALICCDGCPSTFHQSCLSIKMLPPGEWHCPNCTCKFCAIASGTVKKGDAAACALLTCNLCEKKYHESCAEKMDALSNNSNVSGFSFCGKECKQLFEHLKKFLGAKHELEAGFSWSLIHRTDEDSEATSRGIFQRVECNSKLAVALTIMNECFLPVVDRRSGINLIHNVLYNSGSNFSRLNYNGFYTAILERGDEIISAASIRFHGTRLVEMPFIGTRHIYRRQGMCRRLFSAIESALRSMKVEIMIIPAIAELMQTWTMNFGFTDLEESLRKELRFLNILVFPGINMLQKVLVEKGNFEGNTTASGVEKVENADKVSIKSKLADRSADSSNHQDPDGSANMDSNPVNEIYDECYDASEEIKNQVLSDRTVCSKSHSEDRLSDSTSDKCSSPSDTSHVALEMENYVQDNLNTSGESRVISLHDASVDVHRSDAPDCPENCTLVQETAPTDPSLKGDLVEPVFDRESCLPTLVNGDSSEHDVNPVVNTMLLSREVGKNNTNEIHKAVPSSGLSEENITTQSHENADMSDSILNHADESSLQISSGLNGETMCQEGNLHVGTVASENMRSDENRINASNDSSETDQE
ncbi:uncharacterized protein LOC129320061 [Prosopis cineraria]|uniref:uncharacterized protein LOC129320061 n=1 Tax=Prosopis cineraria TaxID=364024 RepID=UPI00240F1B55|nr:uncharacterized protein LOC129320061 [Prosopis cineraria]